MRILNYIFALLCVLVFSSCLDGYEEYWLERDGSGRLEARYELPAMAIATAGGEQELQAKIESFFAGQEGVELRRLLMSREKASVILNLEVAFDDIGKFSDLLKKESGEEKPEEEPDALELLLGTMETKREGLSIELARSVDIRKLFGGGFFAPSGEQTAGKELEYVVHLPVKVGQSNAHAVTDDGKTLRWAFPLDQALREPLLLQLKAPIPLPYGSIIGVCALLIAVAVFILRWRKNRKKNLASRTA